MDLETAVAVSMLPVSRTRASAVYKDLRQRDPAVTPGAVLAVLHLQSAGGEIERAAIEAARAAIAAAGAAGMQPIGWFDPCFPPLLNCISDPPPVLWARGRVEALQRPAVAIVGSRAATHYALDVAGRLAAELAGRGVVVVSGLARGVDSAAHRGALGAAKPTIAVLGSGLDRIYPAEHRALAASITEDGLLLSELGPGGPPLPEHFPLRNRIISGISLAVVVVEANENSGSLITARHAMEQGRDVMAVPGSVLSGRNRGSHSLLKDGAKVVEAADDILEELGWPSARAAVSGTRKSLTEDNLLAKMDAGEAYGLDQLVLLTGLPAPRVLTRLMELELTGQVGPVPCGRFARLLPRG